MSDYRIERQAEPTTELYAVTDPHTGVVRGNSRGLMVRLTPRKARQLIRAHPLHEDDTRQRIVKFVPEQRLTEMRASRDQYCDLLEASKTLLEQAERERDDLQRLKRRIEKLNKRRAADREVVANAEMTLAKLAQAERERDDARRELATADAHSLLCHAALDEAGVGMRSSLSSARILGLTRQRDRARRELQAAQQEVARLRDALQQIENSDAALSNYGLYALVHNALAAGEEKP